MLLFLDFQSKVFIDFRSKINEDSSESFLCLDLDKYLIHSYFLDGLYDYMFFCFRYRMPERNFEVGNAGANIPGCLGYLEEPFEKEDMSEMFRRAFLEKMSVDEPDRPNYKCFVCHQLITGRTITAMTHKFHPECFVCTYCRKEFKERTFKTDPVENKPYCKICFEKLLGHFGNAHGLR